MRLGYPLQLSKPYEMLFISGRITILLGLLALLPSVLGEAETICFNDNTNHFDDKITPFAITDLQAIIASIQNNNLQLAGGKQVTDSVFSMGSIESIVVQFGYDRPKDFHCL